MGTDPGAVSGLNLTVKTPLVSGSSATAAATADFAKIKGVNLANVPGVTFSSSDTNILTVTSNGTVKGAGIGLTTLTASFQGKTATQKVNVTSAQATAMTHRYSFTTEASDAIGTANGSLLSGATVSGGAVQFDGQGAYVEFPPDLLTNYDSLTMEAWVTDNRSANWARIWDFGDSTGGPGQQGGGTRYMFISLPLGNGNLRGSYTITGGGAGTATISGIFGSKSKNLSLTVSLPANYVKPVLVHRYSFSEAPGSTTVKDSVGTANGTIRGLGAAFDGNGQLSLPGGTSSSADPTLISGYVELPEHIIRVISNLSDA